MATAADSGGITMAKPKEANLAAHPQAFRGTKAESALIGYSTLACISKSIKTPRWFSRPNSALSHLRIAFAGALVIAGVAMAFAGVSKPTAGVNVRVTLDSASTYLSADQLAGGTSTDVLVQRCGTDRRMQNEPTLSIDPRNTSVWASGANDYCTVPTAGDAWAGFYRSTDSGGAWTDSLLPGYNGDTSTEGTSSPLHQLVAGGALAAGDPVMSWDGQGHLFYIGNNFNRGIENGVSGTTRDNTRVIWVAMYAPSNPADPSTDGSKYLRTVVLASNPFGLGSFNDKTNLAVDPSTGNVYAAWSDFHGAGCNQILFSQSTDHGATFSRPLKISSGICVNQGPSIAIGPSGKVYVGWEAIGVGAAFVSSSNFGLTFTKS